MRIFTKTLLATKCG